MNKKQILIALMLVLGLLLLVGCTNHNGDYSISYGNGTKEDFDKEPDESELKYYDSIEEAILSNEFNGEEHVTNIKKIIKVLNKDDDCLILFITELDNQDILVSYKLKTKGSKDNIQYSTPCYAKIRAWKLDKDMIDEILKCPTKLETLIEKVDSDLFLNNHSGTFNIGDSENKVAWGLWDSNLIKKLKIDGASPTEIIELKMDGDKVYFWYYENLELDFSNYDMELITVD